MTLQEAENQISELTKQVEAGRRAAEALMTLCEEAKDFGGRNKIVIHGGIDHQKGMDCKICEALRLCREAGLLGEGKIKP